MPEDTTAGRIECESDLLAGGFVQTPIVVLRDKELSAGAKLTYGGLLWYLWRGGTYPGQVTMAEEFGIGERSVRRYLAELEERGYLAVKRHGLGQPNTYTILCPWERDPDRPNWPVKAASIAGQGGKSGRSHRVVQDVKAHTPQQQQLMAPPSPTAADTTVVAVPKSPTSDSNGLPSRLEALGVWSPSISALLEAHDATRVEGWVGEIEARLQSGGEFRSGPAAFLVAALKGGWPLPDRRTGGNGKRSAELARLAQEQEAAAAAEADRERNRLEESLGIDEETRELWQRVRERLQEQGHGHWSLASAYLGPIRRGLATVTTPAGMLVEPLEDRGEAIRAALEEATGKTVKAVEVQVAQM